MPGVRPAQGSYAREPGSWARGGGRRGLGERLRLAGAPASGRVGARTLSPSPSYARHGRDGGSA